MSDLLSVATLSNAVDGFRIDVLAQRRSGRILLHICCKDPDPFLSGTSVRCIAIRESFCGLIYAGWGIPVPVAFTVFMEGTKHNWQNSLYIIAHQTAKVFVIPEIQSPFRDLEFSLDLWTGKPGNADLTHIWRVDGTRGLEF